MRIEPLDGRVAVADEEPGRVRAEVDGGDVGHAARHRCAVDAARPTQRADGVVAAGEVPGVVGVQALHALAGAADAAATGGGPRGPAGCAASRSAA